MTAGTKILHQGELRDLDELAIPNARFAQSTIDATIWLAVYKPDRLATWLKHHQPARALAIAAYQQIKKPENRTQAAERFRLALNEIGQSESFFAPFADLSPLVRVCKQCNKPHDGREREVLVGSFLIYLHPECEPLYIRRLEPQKAPPSQPSPPSTPAEAAPAPVARHRATGAPRDPYVEFEEL